VLKRVATSTFAVFHRNFPASQNIVCSASSWQTTIWLAVPLIWCLITPPSRVVGRSRSHIMTGARLAHRR
jgi:hypothetical protein